MKNDSLNIKRKLGSIRTRLMLFYTIAAFILLTLVALFLYWGTINILYKADYQFLSDEVDTIQYILEESSPDWTALKQAVVEVPRQPGASLYHYFIRVYDAKKNLLIATPGINEILQTDNSVHKTAELLVRKRYLWYSHDDKNYLLIQAPIKIGHEQNFGLIQIALDISYQHNVISDRKKLIATLLFGTLCSILLGFLIAKRGMRSLYLLVETAEKITVTSLHERIDPKFWPAELRTLGTALNQMLDRIEESFVRLKQFSADLAHEMRTPITNLIGQTEIVLSYPNSVNEYKEVMTSNLEEFQRVSSLIENILFLARAENPQLDLRKTLLYVHDEIALVCDFYQAIADEKNIQISYTGEASLMFNSTMFRRMINNLLSNAIKYTASGGWVRLQIQEPDKHTVQIIVSDNGMGIEAIHLPKIFDRFYRTDTARAQKISGTGLGLALVKSIVDLHQGNIFISSELQKGTTVFLTFRK